MFLDKTSGKNVPLCNRPDCEHNTEDCNANSNYTHVGDINIRQDYLQFYDGDLYLNRFDEEGYNCIYKVAADGSSDKRPFRKYSLGMKQRIILAQALMEKPRIIMLDEPTNAIDEKGVCDIRNIIREEKARGALIMIASHNKEDIEELADVVYKINEGRVSEQ